MSAPIVPLAVTHDSQLALCRYQPHPIAAFVPDLEERQLDELADSVRQQGLVHDITLFEGTWHKLAGRCHPGRRPLQNAEFVILAEKGNPEFIDTAGLKTCFTGAVGKHSEKPLETTGRRLELFARKPHEGFEPHGNEIDWSAAEAEPETMATAVVRNPRTITYSHQPKWIIEGIELTFHGAPFSVCPTEVK